ncbi:hypothetical protein MRX96_011739 [Rhipicephalus microplus]
MSVFVVRPKHVHHMVTTVKIRDQPRLAGTLVTAPTEPISGARFQSERLVEVLCFVPAVKRWHKFDKTCVKRVAQLGGHRAGRLECALISLSVLYFVALVERAAVAIGLDKRAKHVTVCRAPRRAR